MNIAAIFEDDKVWALPTWERTFLLLAEQGANAVGMWKCPVMLARHFTVTRGFVEPFKDCGLAEGLSRRPGCHV